MKATRFNFKSLAMIALVVTAVFAVSCDKEEEMFNEQSAYASDADLKAGRSVAPGDQSPGLECHARHGQPPQRHHRPGAPRRRHDQQRACLLGELVDGVVKLGAEHQPVRVCGPKQRDRSGAELFDEFAQPKRLHGGLARKLSCRICCIH